MTKISREITRVDFVKQPDGTTTFCVEVTESAPDPFNAGNLVRRRAEPAPMTPEMAKERYGFTLADIIGEINEAVVADNSTKAARISEMEHELMALKGEQS